jgi:hypothetical protein
MPYSKLVTIIGALVLGCTCTFFPLDYIMELSLLYGLLAPSPLSIRILLCYQRLYEYKRKNNLVLGSEETGRMAEAEVNNRISE